MIDAFDKQTIDAFPAKRGRGRPVTSSDAKRRSDGAARAAKHRAAKKRKKIILEYVINRLSDPALFRQRSVWLDLLAFLNANIEDMDGIYIDWLTPEGKERSKVGSLSFICDLIANGNEVTGVV